MPVSVETRRSTLQSAINRYIADGYRVVSQTDTTAQLVRPKKKLSLIMLILLGLTVVGLLYVAWRITRKEKQVYLQVDDNGQLQETHS